MYQAPTGTNDLLPEEAHYWAFVESEARRQARLANYGEIRTPTFENTAVFQRGVGAATDIVEKEMYTFETRGGDSLTLRPEGTAAVVRAYLEHGMASRPQPVKLYSLISAFRHDRPQQGRYREFHQLNAEALGEDDPMADADLVALQWRFYRVLGLSGLALQVNSIGDPACRPAFIQALSGYLVEHETELCPDCRRRIRTNPLRVLDCKTPSCQPILKGAPRTLDFLCEPCSTHLKQWLAYLHAADIAYTINPRLVRGLDYYTRSVWEVWPPTEGAQSTIGAGGRYDGLAEQLGGKHVPGVGFATGIERVILELKKQGVPVPPTEHPDAFLVYQRAETKVQAFQLVESLRAQGVAVDLAFGDRRLGKQLGAADRSGAQFAIILGDDEVKQGAASLKDLREGAEQRTVPQAELATALLGSEVEA